MTEALPDPRPDAGYWRRTLRPWKGEWVAVGLRSGAVCSGRLVDASEEGPVLEWPHEPRAICRWHEVQYVEHRLVMLRRFELEDPDEQ